MGKLDVGVGDEFPADEIRKDDEIRTDEDGVVHHHHYYYRRRGPFRFLRIILAVTLIGLVVRVTNFAFRPGHWYGYGYGYGDGPGRFEGNPMWQLGGLAVGIVVIGGWLWLLQRRDPDGGR